MLNRLGTLEKSLDAILRFEEYNQGGIDGRFQPSKHTIVALVTHPLLWKQPSEFCQSA